MRGTALWLAALVLSMVGAFAQDEREVVIEERDLTAIGQHSPAVAAEGEWYCFLRYVVRPDGQLGQALHVARFDGRAVEKRVTQNSLIYHPAWRKGASRIICVAVPDAASENRTLRPGIYEVDASGQSEPALLVTTSARDLPFAPTVNPEDRLLAYLHYSSAPEHAADVWLFFHDLLKGRPIGEAVWPEERFRIAETTGPWWHARNRIRMLGERTTEKGIERWVYEYNTEEQSWNRVFRLPEDRVAWSFAYAPVTDRLARLQESDDYERLDLVVSKGDGADSYVVASVTRPFRHLPRPFPNDLAWLANGQALTVTSGGNIRLLQLGQPGGAAERATKANMTRIYNALRRHAYDHGGLIAHWEDVPQPLGAPNRNPHYWMYAIQGAYITDPNVFYSPLDRRDRDAIRSSYEFNMELAGHVFDQEALKQDVWFLREAEAWHERGRLVLYTSGEFGYDLEPED